MVGPSMQMMQTMYGLGAMPNLCAPGRVVVGPAALEPWMPLVAMAWDPRANPWLAFGFAFGPFAAALRIEEGGL